MGRTGPLAVALATVAVVALLALALLGQGRGAGEPATRSAPAGTSGSSTSTSGSAGTGTGSSRDDPETEQDVQITLVGDSLIEWGDWAPLLEGEVTNRGVAGETTAQIADRARGALAGDEDVVVLWTGTNDVAQGLPTERTRADLVRLLGEVAAGAPEASVVILEVPPLAWAPDRVDAVNAAIAEEAGAVGATVVPVAQALAAEGARSSDGVHIEPPGYEAVAELIRQELR